MGISIADNFNINMKKPIDGRMQYATLAAMKAVVDANINEGCLAYCEETDKYYKFLSTNTVDADTGKWREFSSGGGGSYTAGDSILINNNVISGDNMQSGDMADVVNPTPGSGSSHLTFDANPTGTILAFMGVTAPVGYLFCDGATYNISTYPTLAEFFRVQFGSVNYFGGNGTTTFAVPDLRGEFLRCTGTNSHANNGNGENVGTHQDATLFPITGQDVTSNYIYKTYSKEKIKTVPLELNEDNKITASGMGGSARTFYKFSGTQGSDQAASWDSYLGSRPTNTSVLYCIKY